MILTLYVDIAKGADPTFTIKLNNDTLVQYCKDSVQVAKSLTIEGTPGIKVMKISISQGFIPGEDLLVYKGGLTQTTPYPGTLVLTGGNTVQDYLDAIHMVSYKNSKAIPTHGVRKITILLSEVAGDPGDYLPATGHYYKYISYPGINWTAARDSAMSDARMYSGLRGYLATITTQAENDFIKTKTPGVGWIGASDAASEGYWRWVTGPEGLRDGGQGLLFWKGTGYQAKTNPSLWGSVKDSTGTPYYQNWNRWDTPYSSSLASTTWEPNDTGGSNGIGEDYAHITVFPTDPNDSYKWNDLPNAGGTGDYYPAGYIIEYGGMPGDPVSNLSATIDLQVNTIQFSTLRDTTICAKNTVILNRKDSLASYSWSHPNYLSSGSVSNPIASPDITTTFVAVATIGGCKDSASFKVNVNPLPVSLLKPEENICQGSSVTLDPGNDSAYKWYNGTTVPLQVSSAGSYIVNLTTTFGCKLTDTVNVFVHQYPKMIPVRIDTLICGSNSSLLDITTNAASFLLNSSDNRVSVSGLQLSVSAYGTYPIHYQAIDQYCKSDTSFKISFHNIPTVGLSIDSTTCYHYNLAAAYKGDADTTISKFTWVFGGDTIVNGIGQTREKIPLGVNQPKRDLVLKVTQDGCSNDFTLKDIKVIPTLSLSVKDTLRCQPDLFQFSASNTETGVRYDWDFGDGTKGTGNNTPHNYSLSGKYDIQLTVTTNKNCTNTIVKKDMVFAAPVPDVKFSLSPDDCLNPGINAISYTGIIGTVRDKYNWDLSQFDPIEIIQDPLQAQGPFQFDLKNKPSVTLGLTVISEFNCKSAPGSITVKRKPDFKMASDIKMGCIPFEPSLSAIINDPVDKVDFTWDFGDGSTAAGSNLTHIYNQPGNNYNVSLTGTSTITGCFNSILNSNYLGTYPKPTAAFSMDNSIVYNDKPDVKFTDTSEGATQFLWDFGDGTSTTVENPTHSFVIMGHKKVLLQAFNEFTCSDTISHEVLVAFSKIFPPNAFSPNAPNSIDREFLLTSEGMKQDGYHLTILSRWNDIVFETKNGITGWDGRMKNGSFAPAGTYLWILNFTDFLGRQHQQTGTVSLVY